MRSILLTAQTFGPRNDTTERRATKASPRPTPAAPSTTSITASTPATASSARRFNRSPRGVLGRWYPGVSVNTIWRSGPVRTPRTGYLVVCGLFETMATFVPTIALIRLDLPVLGRPTTATTPERKVIPGREGRTRRAGGRRASTSFDPRRTDRKSGVEGKRV